MLVDVFFDVVAQSAVLVEVYIFSRDIEFRRINQITDEIDVLRAEIYGSAKNINYMTIYNNLRAIGVK